MKFAGSIVRFEESLKEKIKRGDLDSALHAIESAVDYIVCEPINTAQIFGSRLLDGICQEIGAENWRKNYAGRSSDSSIALHGRLNEKIVVYIVSRLYASGGHTAALADIIRLAPAVPTIILVTGIGGPTDHPSILHRFESINDVSFEYAPRGTHHRKLNWLQGRLHDLKPDSVWLFNHHQDSVAIAAVQPDAGYRLHFCHHGDHHLCLGVYLTYADHVDLYPLGFHHCRNTLGFTENRYLPLVASDLGDRPASTPFNDSGFLTCTAAGANKVEIPYFINYAEIVPQFLLATGGRHLHLGRLTRSALRRIRVGMRKQGLPASAFIYIPYVPSVWRTLQEYRVDLYIASFPYGGARTLVEAMGAGIPLAVHSHCSSRLLGAFDMAYDGALIWREPRELLDGVRRLNSTALFEQGKLARKHYEHFHSELALKNALVDQASPLCAPPLLGEYTPNELQHAFDISAQVTYTGVFRRFRDRSIRRFKWILDWLVGL